MKFLVVSDIHANMDALEEVLKHANKIGYDKIVCLGDIVGYGPNPNEVVEWARAEAEKGMSIVTGNHDIDISRDTDIDGYNPDACNAIMIQRNIVTDDNKNFLRSLQTNAHDTEHGLHFVHGSPRTWDEYVFMPWQVEQCNKYIIGNTCFIGHTHYPHIWKTKEEKVIVNVGSVGQPRDNNPNSCAVIFDTDTKHIEHFRTEYDVKKVQDKMRKQKYSQYLIQRLAHGN